MTPRRWVFAGRAVVLAVGGCATQPPPAAGVLARTSQAMGAAQVK